MKANVCLITIQLVALLVTSCDHQKPTGTTGVVSSGGSSGVVVKDDTIALNGPNSKTLETEKINSILKHYNKTLFRVEEYKNGQLTATRGEMNEAKLGEAFKYANLKRQINEGFSHYSGAVTCCGGGSTHATPTPGPTPPSAEIAKTAKQFDELKLLLGQDH